MDVTPVVQILEAMPDSPSVNINLININGDFNMADLNAPFGRDFAHFGNLNAPFGQDFLDVNKFDDNSANTNVGGVQSLEKTQGNEVQKNNFEAPKLFPDSPSLPKLF